MRRTIPVALFLLTATTVAAAQPAPPPSSPPPPPSGVQRPMLPPPPAAAWDSRGWVMLGERTVGGNVDKDRLEVGKYEGKFSKLTVVVQDSDLEMMEFRIVFGDRTEYNPKVAQYFKEGQRTRVIDLPPSEQIIRFIDFKYRNLPGGGRAKVQVWAWKVGEGAVKPPPPGPTPLPVTFTWDSKGWTKLGDRQVNGRVDRDRIEVGKYEGKFSKLTIVVKDSDLELMDFSVKFARGPEWRPDVKHYFREGQRTRVIDVPGDERMIKHIDVKYRNLPGGGRASIEVWGLRTEQAAPAPMAWDSQGWTMLGERVVNGRNKLDRDRIRVGRDEGKFRKLTIVVLDSDLEMVDAQIKFGRGKPFSPDLRQTFREGSRTRVIDLPGDDRVIKWIEFSYRNLPGGGKARVQAWAR